VHVDGGRRLAVPDQSITIEVPLDRAAAIDGDLAEERVPQSVDDAALGLSVDARAIDDDAAVERAGDPVDGDRRGAAGELEEAGSTESSTTCAQYDPNV
jgi:hypothetical protein